MVPGNRGVSLEEKEEDNYVYIPQQATSDAVHSRDITILVITRSRQKSSMVFVLRGVWMRMVVWP